MIRRGEVWWADLEEPRGVAPVVVLQSDDFNRSRIGTVVALAVSSKLRLLDAPGNVLLMSRSSGLLKDSVANVSQVVTIDREMLTERAGKLDPGTMLAIGRGVRLVLGL